MVVYDDLEPSEKVKVYDKGIALNQNPDNLYQLLISYRTGDMLAPQLDTTEALRTEIRYFLDCIEKQNCPLAECEAAVRVIRILEAATRSMAAKGAPVDLRDPVYSRRAA
jgi:hypothetical protein